MNRKIMGMGIGMLGAAMLLAGCGDQKLQQAQEQLTAATNELTAARTETTTVKTQMQAKVDELQQTILKLNDDNADAEKKMASLKSDMDSQRQQFQLKLQDEQATVEALSQDKTNMTSELKVLTDQIADVNQKYADLEKTHATTLVHLQAMREEYVRLNNEKVALDAKLHDLKALKGQIIVVKQEMHQKRVEELQRLDRAEYAMGNHGYFVKDGSVVVARTPGSYPLNQELYRPE
jgi:chromosome segregation ATPase